MKCVCMGVNKLFSMWIDREKKIRKDGVFDTARKNIPSCSAFKMFDGGYSVL